MNVIKTVTFVNENGKQDEGNALQEFVGSRRNCKNKIQNGRHVNKFKMHMCNKVAKMHQITISWDPCEKFDSTKWGVPEFVVDNIMFD